MTQIRIEALIEAPLHTTWESYTDPKHITQWNFASEDWHCPYAENDVRSGGKFKSRMEAKDGSFGFDFEGVYDEVIDQKLIAYHLEDGRKVRVEFSEENGQTKVIIDFDAENENPIDMQKQGWQAILNKFKQHTECLKDA